MNYLYSAKDIANVVTTNERIKELMPKTFDIIGKGKWKLLELLLKNEGANVAEGSILSIESLSPLFPIGDGPLEVKMTFKDLETAEGVSFRDDFPEQILIGKGKLETVHSIAKKKLGLGYSIVWLKAKTGSVGYDSPFIELSISLAGYIWHEPTLNMRVSNGSGKDLTPVGDPIIEFLRSEGYGL